MAVFADISVERTTLVFNPQTAPYYPAFLRDFKGAAATLAAELSVTPVHNQAEIEAAVPAFAREPGVGLIAGPDPFISGHRASDLDHSNRVQSGGQDPVRTRLIGGLSRPGGNLSGVTNLAGLTLRPKQIEFLHRARANVSARGLLVNGTNPNADAAINEAEKGCPGAELANPYRSREQRFRVGNELCGLSRPTDWSTCCPFRCILQQPSDAKSFVWRALCIPTSYQFREFVLAGGLMSYATDLRETNRLASNSLGRILKGEKPSDLPVQQAAKIEFAINMKTAKALGLTILPNLLAIADEVIA